MEKWRRQLKLPPDRFYMGLLLGLSFALVFYHLCYLFGYGWRIISIDEYGQFALLEPGPANWIHFFLAAWALIMGLGQVLRYWFQKPHSRSSIKRRFRHRLLVDHDLVSWSFSHWIGKIGLAVCALSLWLWGPQGDYDFWYNEYRFALVLLPLVLYTEAWKSLNLIWGRKAQRYMLLIGLLIGFLAWPLSQWRMVDLNSIRSKAISRNPYSQYDLNLPRTLVFPFKDVMGPFGSRYKTELYFIKDSTLRGHRFIHFHNYPGTKTYTSIDSLAKITRGTEEDSWSYYQEAYRLIVDEDLNMGDHVKHLYSLRLYNPYKPVFYAVDPLDRKGDFNPAIKTELPIYYHYNYYNFPVGSPEWGSFARLVTIRPYHGKSLLCDGQTMGPKEFEVYLYDQLRDLRSFAFYFQGWEEEGFGDYFEVIAQIQNVLHKMAANKDPGPDRIPPMYKTMVILD